VAKSWNIATDESIEYDAFVDYFRALGSELFARDLDESARMMRRLANNRRFLTTRLNHELGKSSLKSFQAANLYTPQVFMLYSDENFFVRANIWEPLKTRPGESLFFYESPHDHNFNFLTVGYHGPGYRTELFDYEHDKVVGYADEPVALRTLGEDALPFGRVLFFKKSVDVHTQLPPPELSISVNVLKRERERPDQYFFDTTRSVVTGKADKLPTAALIRLAAVVGDDNATDLLVQLAAKHECRRTRLAAHEAVASRTGSSDTWERALADGDALVRRVAAERLAVAEKAA
jgi:hypothetical protein